MATTTDNFRFLCLLCGTKVNLGEDNSRKEICSRFVTLVSRYLNLKFPIEIQENCENPDQVCCDNCLFAVTEFCDTYERLECVRLELLRNAEGISKLLTSQSKAEFRNEFISSVESKRLQRFPQLTLTSVDDDDEDDRDEVHLMDPLESASVYEDNENPEVKVNENGISDNDVDNGNNGDSPDFPEDYFSVEVNGATVLPGFYGTPKPVKCIFCQKKFAAGSKLVRHMGTHTSERPFWCQFCFKEYPPGGMGRLNQHIEVHHENECRYKCKICEKPFAKRYQLTRHQKSHVDERKFECSSCSEKFKHPQQLRLHKLKFHGGYKKDDQTFRCYSCGIDFEAKWNWLQHQRKVHTDKDLKRSFKCPEPSCELVFEKNHILREHLLTKHSTEKPFQCDQCGISVCNKFYLKKHIQRTHCLTEPKKCRYCDKAFTDKGDLKSHQKSHLFRCDVDGCGKAYKRPHRLKVHKDEVHFNKLYVCEICGEESTKLWLHKIKVHQQGKMFECPDCNYETYSKHHLKLHLPCRRKDKHFQCNVCLKHFKLQQSLKKHLKKFHQEEKK